VPLAAGQLPGSTPVSTARWRGRSSGDRWSEGKTLNVLGLLSWDEGNYDRAIAFRKAGALAADRRQEARGLSAQ
jgi:hypothetical protein